jgi:hypothetical protein
MQQSPDHTDDIRLIQAHRIIAGDGDLPLQTCTNYKDLFKRSLHGPASKLPFRGGSPIRPAMQAT